MFFVSSRRSPPTCHRGGVPAHTAPHTSLPTPLHRTTQCCIKAGCAWARPRLTEAWGRRSWVRAAGVAWMGLMLLQEGTEAARGGNWS